MGIYQLFIENFIKGGLIIGLSMGLIELFHKSSHFIDIFGFLSGSFFVINLYQYYYVAQKDVELNDSLLYYSILGGLAWVLLAIYVYVANRFLETRIVILTSTIVYFAVIFAFLCASGHLQMFGSKTRKLSRSS